MLISVILGFKANLTSEGNCSESSWLFGDSMSGFITLLSGLEVAILL